ncbi:TetR/AcrR family transcriptional regulator [Mycolicibacterium sp. 141076]|uniref:TetR/AcrR family transcriptional regulator n=1 Tax=Mycobacteriaceae TaxID=1762 RepID=UPI00299E2490|nr:TetR/AcrR family transcriptional regulator [Mycolicibacterium sp. 141076]MDX1879751.1 TetR/AcrR family transcriptional regulator [Mycolicibacterium sp. 141076]
MSRPSAGAGKRTTAPRSATSRAPRTIRGLDAEQRRVHRREQLLASAFELIARDGYANTSIEQICQNAFVGNKAFYETFDSKEDCYIELLRQIAERIERQVVEILEDTTADNDDMVERLLSAFAHALVDDPRIAVVAFGECAGISPRVERQRRENRRWTATFVEELWRRREFPEIAADTTLDFHALAVLTVGGLFEAVADWLHDYEPDAEQRPSIDTLIGNLTSFMAVVRAGITASLR